jgi:hypothetical protein
MALRYSFEHLSSGIDVLATHPGAIKDRLVEAFDKHLCHVVPSLLPASAVEVWESAWRQVTAVPASDQEGVFRVSIEALDETAAVDVARQVMQVEVLVRVAIASVGGPDVLN